MSNENHNNTYNIYLGDGGNFNKSIEGNYLQVHGNYINNGNYINISQDLSLITSYQKLHHTELILQIILAQNI